MGRKNVTIFVHSDKDANWDTAIKLGLPEDAQKYFRHVASEVELTYEVNCETGEARLIGARDGQVTLK